VISQGFHASVVANLFLRSSGSRESIHTLKSGTLSAVVQHRVSGSILCPLG